MAYQRSKVNLGNRIQQQIATKDDKGGEAGKRKQYFKNTTQLKFFTFNKDNNEGREFFNILPWTKKDGTMDYVLDTWVHRNIGPDGGDYVCPKQNFGKPCPICEEYERLRSSDWESAAPFKAKRRSMYVVQPINEKGEGDKEPQIFETSQYKFTEPLLTASKSCAKIGQPYVDFVDPDEGKIVCVTTKKSKFGGKDFMEPTRIDFEDRVEEVSDEVLEKCPCLEEFLIVKTYDQLTAALVGGDNDEQNSDEQDGDDEQHGSRFLKSDSGETIEDPYPDQPTDMAEEEPPRQYQRPSRFAR